MEFCNKALCLRPVGDRCCTSENRRSARAVPSAPPQMNGRSRSEDVHRGLLRKSLIRMRLFICRDFRHHRINENAKFPTGIFKQLRPPE